MDLLQIFRNYFLGFLYLHDTPLSVCLYVCQSKNLTRHLLLNYWMDLLQICRNYFLGSLYGYICMFFRCPSVCLSKYVTVPLLLNYWIDLLFSNHFLYGSEAAYPGGACFEVFCTCLFFITQCHKNLYKMG